MCCGVVLILFDWFLKGSIPTCMRLFSFEKFFCDFVPAVVFFY